MTATRSRPRPASPWTALLASLIPWATFLLATALTDVWVVDKSTSPARFAAGAPLYLGFVALPSLVPLAAARPGGMRTVVLILMTAVAAIAGILVVSTDDAQAGLAVLWVTYVAIPLGAVLWIGQAVAARRATAAASPESTALAPAGVSDRLAALVIDLAIVGTSLVVPLTALSRAKHEVVAGLVGVGIATMYLAVQVAMRNRTVGQSLLGLTVVDTRTLGRIAIARALIRSLLLVLEVAAIPTIILSLPAIAELVSVSSSSRSLTDKLLRTSVVTTRRVSDFLSQA